MSRDVKRACAEIFAQDFKVGTVDRCTAADPAGECQFHSVNEHSPGPVQDEELIARWVVSPPHLSRDAQNSLCEQLFDDALSIGASILRMPQGWQKSAAAIHAAGESDAEMRRRGKGEYAATPDRVYLGAVHLTVQELRALQLPEIPVASRVRVYDTALPGVREHADIMVYREDINGDSKSAKQRRKGIKVLMYNLAAKKGLFVSPDLDADHPLVKNIGVPVTVTPKD